MAKREYTIEELQAQYEALGAELEARKRAEAEERETKLRAEKDARYKEVIDAYENFEELRSKYVDDYGSFTFKTTSEGDDICDWVLSSLGLF